MNITITPESEWLSSNRMSASDVDNDSLSDMDAKPPVHPVPQMQGAFEESMMETLNESEDPEPQDRMSNADSVSRRKMLLEQDEYQRTVAGRWKQRPGEQFHPLWKLVAQISFGMHLLQQGVAKSDEEVIKILQNHVDDIDGFLERTTEDFDLAQGDIDERIRYLKLPLEHGSVFDTMLNDRNFRTAIVEGNEKIEHIIDRTAAAMNDALKDVQKGLDATRELAKYLTRLDKQWDERTEEHDSVYLAMIGNTEGWTRAFLTLQSKGNALRRALVQLGGIVAEMQKKASAARQRNLVPVRSVHGSRYMVESQAKSSNHSTTPPKSPLKPLPTAPHGSTRSSSQHHSRQSSRSHSGQHDPKQAYKYAPTQPRRTSRDAGSSSPRVERAMSAKRVEPVLRDTTPEPFKPPKSAEPPIPAKSKAPVTPQESLPKGSQTASPASVTTTIRSDVQPGRISTEKRASARGSSESAASAQRLELRVPMKSTDPIIAAREASPKPPVPVRSPSRKPSFRLFTDRARFHLTHKRSRSEDFDKDDDASSTKLPIQSPPSHDSPEQRPSSPVVRRLSTRRANAVSMSTYSASPTSTSRPLDSPLSRNMSPPGSETSGRKPSHSSYNSISFLPLHPQLSPLPDYSTPEEESTAESSDRLKRSTSVNSGTASKRASMINQPGQVRRSSSVSASASDKRSSFMSNPANKRASIMSNGHPKRSSSINIPNSAPLPDDSEGSVNMQHPLLREARHAKFANTTMPSSPANGFARDLPLRHYHSQDNFHSIGFAGRPKEIILPKRTSSLLYNPPAPTSPSAHPALSSAPLDPEDKLSPALGRLFATAASLGAGVRPDTAASVRQEPGTTRSSPSTVASEDSEGATPPPISRGIRPSSKLDTNVNSTFKTPIVTTNSVQSPTSPSSKPADSTTASPSEQEPASQKPKFKPSTTNNIPFYLNPASSAALIDFLKTSPPSTPPHHHQRATSDPNAFDTQNLYRNYRVEDGKSPVPPGPGGMPMLPLSLSQAAPPNVRDNKKKAAAWRRMFGARVGGVGAGTGKSPLKTVATPAPMPIPGAEPVAIKEKVPKGKKASRAQGMMVMRKDKDKGAKKERIGNGNGEVGIKGNGSLIKVFGGNRSRSLLNLNGGQGAPAPAIAAHGHDALDEQEEEEEGASVADSAVTRNTTRAMVETMTDGNGNVASPDGGGGGGGQRFMGIGKDGMWISQKNFLGT
ncbi:MAG: hypothetical protein L6R37_001704 [Teloschistes peruensis]|nr:MAG: hypothetical protein L6R37_001704 [Teloschistes peruensis]